MKASDFLAKAIVVFMIGLAVVSGAVSVYLLLLRGEIQDEQERVGRLATVAEPTRDIASICEETAAGIEFFLALEKRPSASWTRWVVIDGHCYVSNWDEVWTCDEAEKILAELQAKHLGAK